MPHNPSDLFLFRWRVPKEGHRWVDARLAGDPGSEPQRFLAPVTTGALRTLFPLADNSTLYREFAQTPTTESGIQGFADHYGLLGGVLLRQISLEDETAPIEPRGEQLDDWVREITAMREAVEVYDLVHKRDVAELARRIKWSDDNNRVVFVTENGEKTIADWHSGGGGHEFLLLQPGDPLEPAWLYLTQIINEHLWRHRVSPQLLRPEGGGHSVLHIVPRSLIGALWLQFSLSVDESRERRRCQICGSWFEVASDAPGRERVYCSAKCRTRAYRQRKEAKA